MRTLLRIDSSARREGSYSRAMADHFQDAWARRYPESGVIVRDLADDPPPHLDQATIVELGAARGESEAAALSDELIAELMSADDVLISCPVYNFGLPSSLKAYIDHVVRSGHTFAHADSGPSGLLSGKSAYILTARGARSSPGVADDFTVPHLRGILDYIGISASESIQLDGTGEAAAHVGRITREAREEIERVLDVGALSWVGPFTEEDRRQITALREGQADAITSGDPVRYSELCAEDVHLMIPGHDIISGRESFLEAETRLLSGTRFQAFEKRPRWIELQGDFAVEVGRQSVRAATEGEPEGVLVPDQKYTHVFRRTPEGWRFAVLTSNSCA